MAKRLRIVLVGLPPLLREVVERIITSEPDLLVDAVIAGARDFDDGDRATRPPPDVFLVGVDAEHTAAMCERLLACSHQRVIGVSADGRRMSQCALRPEVTELGEPSAAELLEAIRGGSRTVRTPNA